MRGPLRSLFPSASIDGSLRERRRPIGLLTIFGSLSSRRSAALSAWDSSRRDQLPQMDAPWPEIFCAMQRILDPGGCMAPSRYEPLWRKDSAVDLPSNSQGEGGAMYSLGRKRVAVITAMGLAAPGALDPESFWRIGSRLAKRLSVASSAWIRRSRDVLSEARFRLLISPFSRLNSNQRDWRGTRNWCSGPHARSSLRWRDCPRALPSGSVSRRAASQ